MLRHRWITERRGEDRRERWLRLTKAGERSSGKLCPLGEGPIRPARRIGEQPWKDLLQLTNQVAEFVIIKETRYEKLRKVRCRAVLIWFIFALTVSARPYSITARIASGSP